MEGRPFSAPRVRRLSRGRLVPAMLPLSFILEPARKVEGGPAPGRSGNRVIHEASWLRATEKTAEALQAGRCADTCP